MTSLAKFELLAAARFGLQRETRRQDTSLLRCL